jgi:hypothetical protein
VAPRSKEVCLYGHPFTEDNVIWRNRRHFAKRRGEWTRYRVRCCRRCFRLRKRLSAERRRRATPS